MQSRGAIKFFAILFALVCLFQLSFTFMTASVERNAREYADSETTAKIANDLAKGNELLQGYYVDSIAQARENYYLDSMDNQVIYLWKYTYKDCKEREINLGLDLKGGMNVTLEVSIGSIVRGLSGNSQNPVFLQAMDLTFEKQKDSQKDFVTLFGEAIEETDPNFSLASIFLYEFRDKGITANSSNAEVLEVIKKETDGAFDRTYNILRTRIDKFGVTQPNVQKIASSNRVLVELPGVKDPERVRKLLQGTAQLEFWETYRFSEIYQYFADANTRLADIYGVDKTTTDEQEKTVGESENIDETTADNSTGETTVETSGEEGDTSAVSLLDQLESDSTDFGMEDQQLEQYRKKNPLYAVLNPAYEQRQQGQYFPSESSTVGYAAIKDTAKVNKMLRQTKNIFPRDLKLAWLNKPRVEGSNILELIALKVSNPREMKPALGGEVVTNARQDYDQNGKVEVSMSMNAEGAKIWKRLTGDNIGRQVAIVLDDYVYSAPNVNSEIPSGMSSISGSMDVEEAQDLANILKAGKLPAPARIVEEAVVGPSLGHEAVNAGLWSFIIAFVLVLVYMLFYYNRAGVIADIALLSNIFFLFGVLASFGAVLTLPGIAGIVLTLGMAVDANVIIYERIKEEVRAGKGLQLSIADGYKNAYSAIIDGNVTTLLTGIVLFVFGSGPVQGFATTLIIGILSSLFSAIFISRLIFTWALKRNIEVNFANKFTLNVLANTSFDFISKRKIAYFISAGIITISILSLAFRGLNYGVDFSGGRTYVIRFDKDVNTNEIRDALSNAFIDADGQNVTPEVKTFGPAKQVKVTTKFMIENTETDVDSIIQSKIFNGLKPFFEDQSIVYRDFSTDNETEDKLIGILSSQKVGPTIADDIRNRAVMAVLFALIVIFIYIALRFRKWQFGLAGVIALFHDTMITVGLFSLFYNVLPFNMEIDQAFIAAILTIIGYSINDTVIIFDRIREYGMLYKKRDLKTNINGALNSTLARTINTSGTTLVVLFTIFLFGGEIIRGFTFALLVGILVGTYSSLFTASPIAYDLIQKKDAEIGPEVTKKRKK
ncbi:MAG: protein translocase subunit SecDF [Bacteroidales bacterium]|nr:protein translocase subunit SecDF [Bacteroidales bacterium]MCF8404787.1 protein translocase subunit SecDF [Bacteroidales bacterium]